MNVTELASLMGVSPRDCADFCSGVKAQMGRGLDLEAAIRAHIDSIRTAFEHMAKRQDNLAYGERMQAFVVDAFYPAAQP